MNARGFAVLLVFLLASTACANVPVQEMSSARAALSAAQAAGARDSAPAAYRRAEDLLNRAQVEMEVRSYARAKALAVEAKDAAVQAQTKAQAGELKP